MTYGAKTDYQSDTSARTYEQRSMYKGFIGRRRVEVERAVISGLADQIEPGSTVLDCPCGNGRWLEIIGRNAGRLIARDVSEGMVKAATERTATFAKPVEVALGDAENLDLANNAVDYTFSYALMKHLPIPVQTRVLSEFARVSSKGVFCSFAVFAPISRAWWKYKNPPESYPVSRDELAQMANAAGLVVDRIIKVSQPLVGLEHIAVMSRRPEKA